VGGLWCRPSFRFPPVDLPNWPAAAAPTKPAAVSLGASIAPPDISGAVLGLRKRPETQRRLCGRACLPACLGRLPRRPPRCRTQQRPLRSLLDPVGIQPTTARLLHFSPSSRVESRTRTSSFSTCNLTTYSIPLSDMRDSHLARPSLPPHSNATWCRRR